MATSKKAAKPAKKRISKPSDPARVRTPQGFLRMAIELRIMRIKGFYTKISGGNKAKGERGLYDYCVEVATLCSQKRYHEARLAVSNLPQKSYTGLDVGLEQTIIREEVDSYIRDCMSRDTKFGMEADVVTLDDGIAVEHTLG